VNGRHFSAQSGDNLLRVLRQHPTVSSLTSVNARERQPLVVLDGALLVGGIERVNDVRVNQVLSIVVMRSWEATTRFGSEGASGAIVIQTKRGRTPSEAARSASGCVG